jgi:hypothetical protein
MNVPQLLENVTMRSEQEAIEMAPLKLKFGTADYEVPVLRISKQREWRQKFMEIGAQLFGTTDQPATNASFQAGLAFVFLEYPEKVADLVFAYDVSGKLPQEVILEQATEEQLARAFSKIMVVAFPFARELAMTMQILEKAKTYQRLAKSTN